MTDRCGKKGKFRIEVAEAASTGLSFYYESSDSSAFELGADRFLLAPGAGWIIEARSQSVDGRELLVDTIIEGDFSRFEAFRYSDSDRRVAIRGLTPGPIDLVVSGVPLSIGVVASWDGIHLAPVDETGALVEFLSAEVGRGLHFGFVGRTTDGRVVPVPPDLGGPFRFSSSDPADSPYPCGATAFATRNPLCSLNFFTPGDRLLTVTLGDITGTVEIRVR